MPETNDLLPLNESVAYVLIALADGRAKHGGAIGRQVKRLSNKQVDISPGNLYPMLKRLVDHELLRIDGEVDEGGARRKLYHITNFGQAVLCADQERLYQRQRAADSVRPRSVPAPGTARR
jgi:PadR family transcriptional regulator, regulatory protein PadR